MGWTNRRYGDERSLTVGVVKKLKARPARFKKELNVFKYAKDKGFGRSFVPSFWFRVEYKWTEQYGDEELEYNPIMYGIKPIQGSQRRKFMAFIEKLDDDDIGEATRDVESYFATLAVVKQLDIFAEEEDKINLRCPNLAYVYPKVKKYKSNSFKEPMNVCFRTPDKPFLKEEDPLLFNILLNYIFTKDDFTL